MIKFLDNFRFGRNVMKIGLFTCNDEKGNIYFYIGNEEHKILLEKFSGKFLFDKFLIEAVILRMLCTSKNSLQRVHNVYNNIVSTYKDLSK